MGEVRESGSIAQAQQPRRKKKSYRLVCVLCVLCMLFVRVSRGRDLYCDVVLNLEHCQCVSRRAGKGNKNNTEESEREMI